MGRDTRGVKALLRWRSKSNLFIKTSKESEILTVSENGYGKRSKLMILEKQKRS